MKIAVCVKAVPDNNEILFDKETGCLIRGDAPAVINPYDMVALEAARQLCEKTDGNSFAITMGPPSSAAALESAVAMGASQAFHLCSAKFAGADVLATAYTLSSFIKQTDADIIICGKHSTDGDTGQVGAYLAQFLEMPHSAGVIAFEDIGAKSIIVSRRGNGEICKVSLTLPCVLVIENDFCYPKLPTLRDTLRAKKIKPQTLSEIEGISYSLCGSAGSATRVTKIFVPKNDKNTINISPENPKEILQYICEV